MTRAEYESKSFDELITWAFEELPDEVTTEDLLKDFAISKLKDDNFTMALHIINAIYENPYDTDLYLYDFNMGCLQKPTPITSKEDLEHLIYFDDECDLFDEEE